MPKKGYYYHYKHDPKGEINNYAYFVLGVAKHTENHDSLVIYRPLYEAEDGFMDGFDFCARPLEMFKKTVQRDGHAVPRFTRITDQKLISELNKLTK